MEQGKPTQAKQWQPLRGLPVRGWPVGELALASSSSCATASARACTATCSGRRPVASLHSTPHHTAQLVLQVDVHVLKGQKAPGPFDESLLTPRMQNHTEGQGGEVLAVLLAWQCLAQEAHLLCPLCHLSAMPCHVVIPDAKRQAAT